jgi:7-keto-8-aminopelargonate synthetase-like enzyme
VSKDPPPVGPALSLRDDVLVWTLAIAFGIVGGIVAGSFFVGYHFRSVTRGFRSSTTLDKETPA